MYLKIKSTTTWLPHYIARIVKLKAMGLPTPKHIYFSICDHFEPYWCNADKQTAQHRLNRWLVEWPKLADSYLDSNGNKLKYSFFYPEEEYQKDDLDALAGLCHAGYGEVEVHLHHDNDTADNLKKTLIDFKKRLHEEHGLLSIDKETGDIVYGFIHGNWALNNSRPDGRMCGVNNETDILLETGCYADFTMPSAPDDCQTRKVNSLYYAQSSQQPKAHDSGIDAKVGVPPSGLLMVQGPLGLTWSRPKWGIVPRIENSGLMISTPITMSRIQEWVSSHIHVSSAPEHVFIKLYAHGTQEENMKMFFDQKGGERLLSSLIEHASQIDSQVHFVSAREMVNVIHALEAGTACPEKSLNTQYRV